MISSNKQTVDSMTAKTVKDFDQQVDNLSIAKINREYPSNIKNDHKQSVDKRKTTKSVGKKRNDLSNGKKRKSSKSIKRDEGSKVTKKIASEHASKYIDSIKDEKAFFPETLQLFVTKKEQQKLRESFNNLVNNKTNEYNQAFKSNSRGVRLPLEVPIRPHVIEHPTDTDQTLDFCLLLDKLNDLRANPAEWSKKLMVIYFKPDTKHLNHKHEPDYSEGRSLYKDAFRYLTLIKPLPPLAIDSALVSMAYDQAIHQAAVNSMSCVDGLTVAQRAASHSMPADTQLAESSILIAELDYDVILLNMVVDDGVPSRGRRVNMFNPLYSKIGMAAAINPLHKGFVVDFVYAGQSETGKQEVFDINDRIDNHHSNVRN
jgi:hypothetical protein